MPYDLGYAKRRFPEHSKAIDELASRNEYFRDLCLDFETAELLLLKWKASEAPDAVKNIDELSPLVDELANDIITLVGDASVIPFKPRRS